MGKYCWGSFKEGSLNRTERMEENIVLVCEDSMEGIFTGIYEAYALRIPHERIRLETEGEGDLRLFCTYRKVAPEAEKTEKVIRTIRPLLGEEDYRTLCFALSAPSADKAQAVYRTIVYALAHRTGRSALEHLADDNIRRILELSRGAGNEFVHLRGFLRFQELETGMLYAEIAPRNNVLPMLAVHFADRLPTENFIIFDAGHNLYAIHPAQKEWFLMQGQETEGEVSVVLSEEEKYYQELFRHFCHNISIEGRKNLKLQRNMLPLRFRSYMVEFAEN